MKKAVIFGTGPFAELLVFFLEDDKKVEICGFVEDGMYRRSDSYMGLPLVDFETVEKHFPSKQYGIYICIGYTDMNSVRKLKFSEAERKGYEILSYCHPSSLVNAKAMGKGNIVMENVVIGAFSEIGDGNVFYANAQVAHHSKIGDFNFFAVSASVAGNVNIGEGCFFGNNCTVRDGIEIADRTLIGAGCYISKSTESYGVYVPSRSIKLHGRKSTDFHL